VSRSGYQQRVKGPRLRWDESIRSLPVWERSEMRQAIAGREINIVFRMLQRYGVPQRRIAAETGLAQSDISGIIAGRQVMAYDVLLRVARGLGIPRGQMGLAYDPDTLALFDPTLLRDIVNEGEVPPRKVVDGLAVPCDDASSATMASAQ